LTLGNNRNNITRRLIYHRRKKTQMGLGSPVRVMSDGALSPSTTELAGRLAERTDVR